MQQGEDRNGASQAPTNDELAADIKQLLKHNQLEAAFLLKDFQNQKRYL